MQRGRDAKRQRGRGQKGRDVERQRGRVVWRPGGREAERQT